MKESAEPATTEAAVASKVEEAVAAMSAFTLNESTTEDFATLSAKIGCGALDEANFKYSEMSRYFNSQRLNELCLNKSIADSLVKVKQVHTTSDGRALIEYEDVDAGFITLEKLLSEVKLSTDQVKQLLSGLIKMLKNLLKNSLKHLATGRILVNKDDLTVGAKIFVGDAFCF